MTKLLALTDLHLTTGGETVAGLNPARRFDAALTHALKHHPDATAMILMGDLAHHGAPGAYATLTALLARVPCPVIPMTGNHDRRKAYSTAFPEAPRTAKGFLQAKLTFPGWTVLTLDTLTDPPRQPGDHAGDLCPDRLAWLDEALKNTQNDNLLVFAHHPPFRTGLPGMDAIGLRDGDALLNRLSAHGRAHLICGHIHRTISGSTEGVGWTVLPSPCHNAPLDLIRRDSALSIDEGPGYGVILLTDTGVIVHIATATDPPVIRDPASA